MKTMATCHPFTRLPIVLAEGTYKGTWSGYTVKLTYNGVLVEFTTEIGVRGINVPATIVVKDNQIYVE